MHSGLYHGDYVFGGSNDTSKGSRLSLNKLNNLITIMTSIDLINAFDISCITTMNGVLSAV